ncbi:nucleotide exchange factor GrpE [Streptomyces sp. NPDC051219]|uniref:nucleotide exchange factor GrpE n=1 Tax=Streptomyces sp. NPDC051219 TaxID=3155283 RepID=UPI003426FA32
MRMPHDPPAGPRERGERPVLIVHDRRRTGPHTLQLRPSEDKRSEAPPVRDGPDAGTALMSGVGATPAKERQPQERLAEFTGDLQRLKAEYDNYRKRVQRDRLAIREIAVANVLTGLLPVLDAVEQARRHGEVTGPLTAIADLLESHLTALGLQPVGTPGQPFDPTTHEALTYRESPAADQPVCTAVLRRGYRVGDHLLRPAQVSVTGPAGGAPQPGR